VRLIATKAFPYGGHRLKPDEEFEATKRDATTLVAVGKARRATYRTTALDAESPKTGKRTYKRRDMVAE
jgi:hypothetical protein